MELEDNLTEQETEQKIEKESEKEPEKESEKESEIESEKESETESERESYSFFYSLDDNGIDFEYESAVLEQLETLNSNIEMLNTSVITNTFWIVLLVGAFFSKTLFMRMRST